MNPASRIEITLQWGHDLAVMERRRYVSSHSPLQTLQWGHDLAVMESRTRTNSQRRTYRHFNGAMTLRSWREALCEYIKGHNYTLQWGHDLAVMESG